MSSITILLLIFTSSCFLSLHKSTSFCIICNKNSSFSTKCQSRKAHYNSCFCNNDEIIKIYNPLSKRYIQQTDTSKQKKNKWNEFMLVKGGYIAYCGELVPIDLNLLNLWNGNRCDSKVIINNMKNNEYSFESQLHDERHKNETWHSAKVQILESYNHKTDIPGYDESQNNSDFQYPILEQLLFVNKPSKWLTLPGIDASKATCLASHVNHYLKEDPHGVQLLKMCNEVTMKHKQFNKKDNQNKSFVPRPCHRLDYDTSGIIAFGLCVDSLRHTSKLFELRQVKKTYVALVAGHLKDDHGVIEYPIGKVPTDQGYNKFACLLEGQNENVFIQSSLRPAKTYFKVSKRFSIVDTETGRTATYTRIELEPHTGRGHQLRLHMEAIGHPILGDSLHGNVIVTPRLCLHAMSLSLVVRSGIDTNKPYQKIIVSSTPPF